MMLLVLLYLLYDVSECYKILVYSAPLGFSHIQFMGRIADILQEAGHDVTVLHPVREPKHKSAVAVSAKKILFELPEDLIKKASPSNMNVWNNKGSILDHMKFFKRFIETQAEACDLVLSDNSTMDALRKEHFDVGITEMIGSCAFGLFHLIDVNHIICASAVGTTEGMSQFFDSPMLPTFIMPYSDKMNFLERTFNFIGSMLSRLLFAQFFRAFENVWLRHGAPANANEYRKRINYLLSNSDEFLEFAHPSTSKIIHIGGITLPEKPEMPKELRSLMERNDRKGVVYLSFGTVVPTTQVKHRERALDENCYGFF
ncbi:hypothetical protein OESDEN_19991 [Oesophagostomum dentatum]|uniref:glucuronosyltransferase n=1 Tax=Oesophagostomum dentatum TaxID=61180 RepID=A0A0B1SAT0_OESDE|nr:hypothetical protein OESDEN_19991 [Oesophagostomum dentatum]